MNTFLPASSIEAQSAQLLNENAAQLSNIPSELSTTSRKIGRDLRSSVERRYLWMSDMHDRIRAKVLGSHSSSK